MVDQSTPGCAECGGTGIVPCECCDRTMACPECDAEPDQIPRREEIAAAIGTNEPVTVRLIAEIMRCESPSPATLPAREFRALARRSVHEAGVLSVSYGEFPPALELFCLTHGLTVPARGPLGIALRHVGVRDLPGSAR